jgi:hypothetical protein
MVAVQFAETSSIWTGGSDVMSVFNAMLAFVLLLVNYFNIFLRYLYVLCRTRLRRFDTPRYLGPHGNSP